MEEIVSVRGHSSVGERRTRLRQSLRLSLLLTAVRTPERGRELSVRIVRLSLLLTAVRTAQSGRELRVGIVQQSAVRFGCRCGRSLWKEGRCLPKGRGTQGWRCGGGEFTREDRWGKRSRRRRTFFDAARRTGGVAGFRGSGGVSHGF